MEEEHSRKGAFQCDRNKAFQCNSNEKGDDEEEYALPLAREGRHPEGRMLRGGLKERMRKVASKPEA